MSLSRAAARALCAANAQTGLTATDPRLDAQINQAMSRLIRHRNAFTRREEYDAAPIVHDPAADPLQLDAPDSLKLQVLALWKEENTKFEESAALEGRANALVEQDIVQAYESANKTAYLAAVAGTANTRTWYAARLGLDTAGGLATSNTKLKRLVTRSGFWIYQKIYEYQLIERNRIHTAAPTLAVQPTPDADVFVPAIDYETMRLVVQAMALQGYSADADSQTVAGNYLTQAGALLARRLDAELEALRHGAYTAALTATTSNTFGAVKAQLALELPMGLKISELELGRLVNSAERRLVECGKWKGAIADFEVAITDDKEVNMPPEVETVLGATICDQPTLIKGRWYEVTEGGPGNVKQLRQPATGMLVDRGEFTVDGVQVRRYFVSACSPEDTLMVRAKRRFAVKTADATVMQIRNYSALKAAAQTLIHEGFLSADQRDAGLASFYWKSAIGILSEELKEFIGDSAQHSMPVQTVGWGAGEIPCVL